MARKEKLAVTLVIVATAGLPHAWAYQVNCNQASFTAQKISSVFGELRPATAAGVNAQGNASARFHTGTDIADCGGNTVVGAIEDGNVQGDPICGTDGLPANDCEVLVVNTAGTHRFDYIHLTPASVADLADGDTVYMGNPVGNVDPNEGHLHLNDVDLNSGFKKNPQGFGVPNQVSDLLFSPPPEPQFVATTVAGVTGSVIPIVAGSEANPQSFPLAADGVTYILNGQVDVLVTADGGIPPSLAQNRIGLYSVGVIVTALQPPFNQAYMGSSDIVFNTLCDGHSNTNCASNNDRSAIPNIYLRSNTNSMTFIATTQKINSDPSTPSVNNPIDLTNTATYPPGNYSICPEILGFPGDTPQAPTVNTQCIKFNIAGPPTVKFNDEPFSGPAQDAGDILTSDNNTLEIDNSGSTLKSVTLTHDDADAENLLPSAIQAYAAAPAAASLSGAMNDLPAGDYVLTVTNSAGLTTQLSWRSVSMSAGPLVSASAAYDGADFNVTFQPQFSASLGINDVYTYLVDADGFIGGYGDLGDSPAPTLSYSRFSDLAVSASVFGYSTQRWVEAVDNDGNSVDFGESVLVSTGTFFGSGAASGGQLALPLYNPALFNTFLGALVLPQAAAWTPSYAADPGTSSGPRADSQSVATFKAYLQDGDSSGSMSNACELSDGTLVLTAAGYDMTQVNDDLTNACFLSHPYGQVLVTYEQIPQTSFLESSCGHCDEYGNCTSCLAYNVGSSVITASATAVSLVASVSSSPELDPVPVVPGVSALALSGGLSVDSVTVVQSGVFAAGYVPVPPLPAGYAWPAMGMGRSISGSPSGSGAFVAGPIQVQDNYGYLNGVSPAQEAAIRVFFTSTSSAKAAIVPDSIDTQAHSLKFTTSAFGAFQLGYPVFVSSAVATNGEFVFVSSQTGFGVDNLSGDSRYPQFLNVLNSGGVIVVSSRTWNVSPSTASLAPPGLVEINYSTAEFALANVSTSALFLAQYSLAYGTSSPLSSVQIDTVNRVLSGYVSSISSDSLFAVFATTASFAAPADLLPPQTSLLIDGTTIYPRANVAMASTASIVLSAVDPSYANAPVSGASATLYAVDSSTYQTYTYPFTLSLGTHVLHYRSVDAAGNWEAVNVSTIVVSSEPLPTYGGLGAAVDSSGQIWTVTQSSDAVALTRRNSSAVFLGSVTLPSGDPAYPWSVVFDPYGNPYAVGSAIGTNGADRVAVYAAATSGSALVSTETYDSGFSNNNLVFAASQTWIVGSVQTFGPIDDSTATRSYSLAIWSVNPTTHLVSMTTNYTRAGFDEATGLAIDSAGHLWISGFSQSPSPRSPRVFDLAVWEYASDGRTLLAGPYIREGFLNELPSDALALVSVSSSVVYVTAPRANAGNVTSLDLLAFSTSGVFMAESAWQSGDGASAYPSGLFPDSSGHWDAVGGFNEPDGTVAGIWRYNTGGTLLSVNSLAAGGARAAASNTNGAWLMVDDSTAPYLDSGETSASGSFADVEPPRTTLVAGAPSRAGNPLYVSSSTVLGLSAVDDGYAVNDSSGVGVQYTYGAINGGSFTPVTNVFSLAAEGAYTLSFYSVDDQGNAEVIKSSSVAVDLTAPTATFISSGTGYAITAADPTSNGVASGVAGINYYVGADTATCAGTIISSASAAGTCANPTYSGQFFLSTGTALIAYQAYDNAGNYSAWQSTLVVVGVAGPSLPAINLSVVNPAQIYTGAVFTATATGTGFSNGGTLEALRITSSGGAWNASGQLSQARKQQTVTALLNGTVIAAGGVNASSAALSSAELYDPNLGRWFALPSMNAARSQFNAVALNNGNLLVLGGDGSAGTAIASAEIYNPSSGTWTTTGSLAHARAQMKSVLLPNGNVLTVGGNAGGALSTCEIYSPSAGTWSSAASLHTARYLETLTVLNDGTVLAAGGYSGSAALSSAEVYSSTANAWTTVGYMAHARENHQAALLNNGSVLVSGGSGSSDWQFAEIYSSTATNWSNTGSMNVARTLHALAVTGQGTPFAIGGENTTSGELSSVEYYDQQTKTWSYSTSLPGTRDYARAATLFNGDVILAGGQISGQPVSSSTLYTPVLGAVAPAASNVQVDSSDVAGTFSLSGATTGYWAIALVTPDQRLGMLSPGVQVLTDTSPPVTTLTLNGAAISSATLSVTAAEVFGFVAIDTGSGVAQTTYAIDGTSAAYVSPFGLPHGTHDLTYFSTDRAGNVEGIHSTTVTVAGVGRGSGGYGLGVDSSELLWSVAYASTTVSIAHNSGAGVFTSSTTLPNADPAFPWNVFFDTAGDVYAIGAAVGTNGADQVAVDRVAPSGAALASTTSYDSGWSNNNFVFAAAPAASGAAWIVGGVQTAGPINDGPGARSYSLAIWSYTPGTGAVQLTTSTTRAGFDVATGLAVDASGNLWISGFSQSPSPLSANVFDLAVWEYAPDGRTLLGGPYLRTGYLPNFDTEETASITLSSGSMYVAAPRANASGGTNIGFTVFNSSGALAAESAWQSAGGSSVYPAGLLQDSYGNFAAVGGFIYGDGTIAGVWRYGASGALSSAVQLDDGGARGGAYASGSLWLMVDGSTGPALDASETTAAGAFADIEPPRTALLPGSPSFSSGTVTYLGDGAISALYAVDDAYAAGDGLGVGIAKTYIAMDTAPYSVYSGTFSLVGEGTYTVSFFSVDSDTNVEVGRSSSVAVDLTPPITTLALTGPSDPSSENGYVVSTTTVFSLSAVDPISNGVASGVSTTYYVIDVNPFSGACQIVGLDPTAANGTCANEAYDGGFTLSVGTHTIYYFSEDEVLNQETLNIASVTVSTGMLPDVAAISPSSGPIGTAFLITGTGFGAYSSTASLVYIGGASAPVSVWLSTAVSGNIPGSLSSGTAAVLIQSVSGGSVVESSGPAFLVDVPTISTITPNTGPTGTGVMIGGFGFGSYNGSDTELLVAGSSVSLSVWIDTEIVWTVPSSLSASTVTVQVSLTPPGGSVTSNTTSFVVTSGGEGGHALGMFGGLAAAPISLAAMPDWYFLGDMLLSSVTGGVLQTPSGAALQVPPYAVAKNTQFTMTRVDEVAESAIASAISQQKLAAAGQAVSFGPPGTLARAVTLVLPYDPSLVTASNLGSLEIYYFDPDTSQWSALPTKVLGSSHLLTAQTSHFSLYQPLMLAPLVSGGGVFDVFGLRTSYAFPNPSHHGAAVDFRLETGLADSVELHVYNLAGRRVLSTSLGAVNFITDPTLGSQDAYDYVWDVSGVGSGIYEFVFVAHKSGEHDVIATGKVGVIK